MPGGAMTAWPAWARSRPAGALVGAVAILLAGCASAGGDTTPRAGQAGPVRHSAPASRPGRVVAHRIAGTPGPGSTTHGSGPRIATALCAPPLGDPVVNRAGAAPRLRA